MNSLRVIVAMILKEFRTTVRERQQLIALIISVLGLSLALSSAAVPAGSGMARSIIRVAGWGPVEISVTRWICIAVGGLVGTFFTLGYVISATVVSFAGEKETKTLELLLASPIQDRLLFIGKCIGVITPSLCLGYVFVAAVAIIARVLYGPALSHLPINWAACLLLLSFPMVLCPCLFLVGVGAIVSARAETSKVAGQVMGAVFFVIFFGAGYGLPLLVGKMGWGRTLASWTFTWLHWSFPMQYAMVVLLLAIPTLASLAIGLLLFRRERLLT